MRRDWTRRGVCEGFARLSVAIGACAMIAALFASPPPQAKSDQRIAVQVGAFRRSEGAASLAEELRQRGYASHTIPSAGIHRVVIGPFGSQSEAETALSGLKQAGYEGYVRKDVMFRSEPGIAGSESRIQPASNPAAVDSNNLRVAKASPEQPAVLNGAGGSAEIESTASTVQPPTTTDITPFAKPLRATKPLRGEPDQKNDHGRLLAGEAQAVARNTGDQVRESPPTSIDNIALRDWQPLQSDLRAAERDQLGSPGTPKVNVDPATPPIDASPDIASTASKELAAAEISQAGDPPGATTPRATAPEDLPEEERYQPAFAKGHPDDTHAVAVEFLARIAQTAPPQESSDAQAEPAAAPVARVKRGLAIKILQGDEVVHTVGQRSARDPVVQVVDENDRPVAGAVVVFDLPARGASGTFANGVRSVSVLTGPDGTATVTGFTANSAQGQYAIQVTASHQGQTATTAVAQANAAAAGGGLSTAATVGIVAGIAGGAAVALVVVKNSIENRVRQEVAARNPPSTITTVSPGPSTVGAP